MNSKVDRPPFHALRRDPEFVINSFTTAVMPSHSNTKLWNES